MITFTQSTTTSISAKVSRPEIELLLCCSRTYVDHQTAERIQTLIQQDIDWTYLIEMAGRNGVIPLLYKSLKTTCQQALPKTILAQLRSYYHANAVHNLLLTQELLRLLEFLQEHDIYAIPFKGPVLAASGYGNLALRQFGDLDILVSEKDFLKAIDLLVKQGEYKYTFPRWFLSDAKEIARLEYINEHSLIRNDSLVSVDIHQNIAARHFFCYPIDFNNLWQRLESVPLIDIKVPNLGLEDLLLILCVHGSKHLWERLAWICDLAELIRIHQQTDWEQIMAQAKKLGTERMLLLGLYLAHTLLRTTLPELIHQKIQADLECQQLAFEVCQDFFNQTISQTEGFSWKIFSFHIRMMERQQDKMHYCSGTFWRWVILPVIDKITPTFKDQQFLSIPKSFDFLYYLIRPIRLTRNLVVIIWQRLFNKQVS
jgi:hypothetical protein